MTFGAVAHPAVADSISEFRESGSIRSLTLTRPEIVKPFLIYTCLLRLVDRRV
jgi:hypothetical protein